MPADRRRAQILELIRRSGGASIQELAASCAVAPITIHRDLDRLAGEGLIKRVRGGAEAIDASDGRDGSNWDRRLVQAEGSKRQIAAAARKLIREGSTIFIDASTTTFALARELDNHPPSRLTVVTNSPAVAHELMSPSIHLIIAPGEVDQNMRIIAGPWTVEFLSQLNFETAFISGVGLTVELGLTTGQWGIADALKAAIAVSAETYALVDSSKLGRSSLLPVAQAEDLAGVIVDRGADPKAVAELEAAGVNVILAGRTDAHLLKRAGRS